MIEGRSSYICTVFFTVFGFCSNFVSFVSPYWIQSVPEAHSQFQRIGFWTVCFDGYMRPSLYDKAYFGCYYIYYVIYDRIRDWLNPAWLYAVQVTSSCGVLIQFFVLFIVLCQVTGAIPKSDYKSLGFIAAGHFFTTLTLTGAIVSFAIARYDSRWMPYPELNTLGWAYVIGVLSLISTFFGFITSFLRYIEMHELIMLQKRNAKENIEEKISLRSLPRAPYPMSTINEPNYQTQSYSIPDRSPSSALSDEYSSDENLSNRSPSTPNYAGRSNKRRNQEDLENERNYFESLS